MLLTLNSLRIQLCCAMTTATLQRLWRWVSDRVKCTHRTHLFIKHPACNRWAINGFYIFPPKSLENLVHCALVLWHKAARKSKSLVAFFYGLWKLHLSSKHTAAMELKGNRMYRNLKTLESRQSILLANNIQTSTHLFFLSPVLNTSHWDCWLRAKEVFKVPLCSKCIPKCCSDKCGLVF